MREIGECDRRSDTCSTLISALFDAEHSRDSGQYRADEDYFVHRQLEYVLDQLWQAISSEPQPDTHRG